MPKNKQISLLDFLCINIKSLALLIPQSGTSVNSPQLTARKDDNHTSSAYCEAVDFKKLTLNGDFFRSPYEVSFFIL